MLIIENKIVNCFFYCKGTIVKLSALIALFFLFSKAEAATYYLMTSQVANARTASNWDTDATGNGAGTNATNFTTAGDVFVVLSSQSATISGGSLQIGSATAAVTLQIDGTIAVSTSQSLIIGVSGANSIVIFNRTSTTSVSGAGNFTLAVGCTLKTANTNGITGTNASVTTSGTNTLPTTSSYEYTGAGTQSITGLPATVVSLTLSGTASVTLDGNQALTGVLTLGPGTTLSLSTFTLGSPTSLVLSCGATSGSVISGTGIMTLGGNVTINDEGTGTDEATISCPVALGATRTFTVADDGTTATDLTISGIMSTNAAGVTKEGAGTMVMTGTNTYRAAVTINNGVISVSTVANTSTSSPLGTGANGSITLGASGTLRYTGAAASSNRPIVLSATGGTIDASGTGTLTLSGAITGNTFGLILTGTGNGNKTTTAINTSSGTLTKQGSGTWTLSFANSYTGLTTVSAGSLTYGVNSAISTGGITVNGATAILNLSTFTESAGTITLDNDGTISGSGTLTSTGTFELKDGTVSAVLAGSAIPLNKTTSGTVTLSGTNTFTGAVTITAGILSVNAVQNASTSSPLGTGAGTPTITIGASGTLQYTGSGHSTSRAIALSGSGATIDASGSGTLTLAGGVTGSTFGLVLTGTGAGSLTTAAIGTGTGTLTKSGSGTWTMSFANTYTGLTTVSAGSLTYGINNAISTGAITVDGATAILNLVTFTESAGTIILDNGGTISGTSGTLTSTGSFDLRNGTVSAILAGSGIALNKTTANTVTLSGLNTFTGAVTISAGILSVNTVANASSGSALGTGAGTPTITIGATGTLQYTGSGHSTTRAIALSAGGATIDASGSGTLTLAGGVTGSTFGLVLTGTGAGSFTTAAIGTTTGTLTKNGSGTWTLSFANTYTGGTTLNAGTLNINDASALGTSGTFTISGGSIDNTSAGNITTNNYILALNGDFTYVGSVPRNLNLGTGSVTMDASRQITVIAGTLTIGGILNDNTKNLTKEGSGTLSFASNNITLGDVTLSNGVLVSTSGVLNILGAFTSTTGTFTHNSGTVNFNGTTQDIPAFTFNNLTISGGGVKTMIGAVTVNAACSLTSGKVAIGSNTLTLNGSLICDASNCLTANGSSNISIGGSGALGSSLFLDQSSIGTSNRLNNLTYNRSSSTITLGDTVEITGTVTPTAGVLATGNYLKLISNASGTARVAAGSGTYITGMVTAERFIPSSARRWRFGGTPVSGRTWNDLKDDIFITGVGTGFDATLTNYSSIYSYDETVTTGDLNTGWVACTNTSDSITVGKGYRIFIRGDRDPGRLDGTISTQNAVTLDLVGDLNINDQPLPVTFNSSGNNENDGWNLVANPYASPIDWNAFHDAGRNEAVDSFNGTDYTNIGQTIYIFDGSTNSYTSFNAISGMGTGNLLTSGGVIPAGAAFWVKAVAASPLDLTMKEVYKTASTPAAVFKTTPNQFTIKLVMDSITSDETAIRYTPQAKEGYDGFDISKMYGSDINIASIAKDGSFLSANCKPFNGVSDTIPLSLGFANSGSYKMEFNNPGGIGFEVNKAMFLIDLYAKQVKDLNATGEYTFTVDKNNTSTFGNDRFKLVVGDLPTSIPEEVSGNNTVRLYLYPSITKDRTTVFSPKTIGENAGVIVTDIGGRIIETISEAYWTNNQLTLDLSHYHTGLYFISITQKGQTIQTLKCIKE